MRDKFRISAKTGDALAFVLASFFLLIVAFFLFFRKYDYNDYAESRCEVDGYTVTANLIGEFSSNNPRMRASPYYLRLMITPHHGDEDAMLEIINARLTPLDDEERLLSNGAIKVQPLKNTYAKTYLAESISLNYENYILQGDILEKNPNNPRSSPFSCAITKNKWSEWRYPFLDRLMSV